MGRSYPPTAIPFSMLFLAHIGIFFCDGYANHFFLNLRSEKIPPPPYCAAIEYASYAVIKA